MATIQAAPLARPQRRPSFVGPLFLIGLGALFLAHNFGLVGPEIWPSLVNYWPVLLIALGLELALGRGSLGGVIGVAVASVVLLAVAWAVFAGWTRWDVGAWNARFVPAGVEQVDEALGDTRQAKVDLSYGAGRLDVSALPADSGRLIRAELEYGANVTIERSVERRDGRVTAAFHERRDRDTFRPESRASGEWTVQLSPDVPTELFVQTGASGLDLNLRDLKVTLLDVQSGASGTKVTLPAAAGRTAARIKSGVSGVDVIVPAGVAARIHVERGLGGLSIDEGRFPKAGNGYYQSRDYETAANRVELEVETGVGGLTIR